jgi:hypothetical protein
MIHEILSDPDWVTYENLFFFLSLGKFDTTFVTKNSDSLIEEFLILGEPWKDQIEYLKTVIEILTQENIRTTHYKQELHLDQSIDFRILIIIYTTPNTGRMIGIGIRIVTVNSSISSTFATTSEDRLQKAMYLISRGLLKSRYHKIVQNICVLPL